MQRPLVFNRTSAPLDLLELPNLGASRIAALYPCLSHSVGGCSTTIPEGPSTQHLRFLVPQTTLLMVSGTKELKYWVLGPSGYEVVGN